MGNKGKATDALGTMVAAVPVVREVKSGDAQLTGVDNDFDSKPTEVELEEMEVATDSSYGKAYDAVPQEQGNTIEVCMALDKKVILKEWFFLRRCLLRTTLRSIRSKYQRQWRNNDWISLLG